MNGRKVDNCNCKRCDDMHNSIIEAHQRIDGKVSWWILASLISVFVMMLGAQFYITSDIKERVIVVQTEIKAMQKYITTDN